MFCRKCGEKLKASDKFCNNCGEHVVENLEKDASIILEPPKDLVWNIEGFPQKSKGAKTPDVSFEWGKEKQGKEFEVDDFYVANEKNAELQKLLDDEIEKINKQNEAREEARARVAEEDKKNLQAEQGKEADEPSIQNTKNDLPDPKSQNIENNESLVQIKEEIDAGNKYQQIFIEEEQPVKKGIGIGKFILVLIIIIIFIEGGFLAARQFVPENPYVIQISETINKAVNTVEKWFISEEKSPAEEPAEKPLKPEVEENEPEEKTPIEEAENPYPENNNIGEIIINPELTYVSGKNYGNVDINESLPVTENTEDVIKTIVSYDSKWIDYVNNGDKGVIEFTAPESPAQLNTLSFAKAGKIKENFLSLEVGEIRKGAKGYYAWTKETIEIIEGSSSVVKTYDWIYQLAPVENEMKIVNYFSYK